MRKICGEKVYESDKNLFHESGLLYLVLRVKLLEKNQQQIKVIVIHIPKTFERVMNVTQN